jgi:hypothetical protein
VRGGYYTTRLHPGNIPRKYTPEIYNSGSKLFPDGNNVLLLGKTLYMFEFIFMSTLEIYTGKNLFRLEISYIQILRHVFRGIFPGCKLVVIV